MDPSTDNLQATVVYAHSAVQASRAALAAFALELESIAAPLHHWHPKPLRTCLLLKRLLAGDTRLLITCLAARPSTSGSDKTEPLPKPAIPISKGPFHQNIQVTVVDGKVISEFDIGARHWLKTKPLHLCDSRVRHYYFPDAVIPKEYAFVLEHKGLYYGPTQSMGRPKRKRTGTTFPFGFLGPAEKAGTGPVSRFTLPAGYWRKANHFRLMETIAARRILCLDCLGSNE